LILPGAAPIRLQQHALEVKDKQIAQQSGQLSKLADVIVRLGGAA
jgi:hypothetical protein